jgi:CDP-4-dehydro-6-deoxyglucose reductase, E1
MYNKFVSRVYKYPLLNEAFSSKDINEGIKVLRSKQITMSKITEKFENYFAKKMGSKFAVMTNSGSSANLLALSCLTHPFNKEKLSSQDEVIIPAICWSTTLWPIIQNNLKPIFVDVDLNSFNIDTAKIINKINKRTKAIMLVHVLGTSTNMSKLVKIANRYKLKIIEDTCESLGAEYNNKKLGTIGNFGTYSFYYSHQITSGEGGMIVCDNLQDYNILKTLRSHGWSRNTSFHNYYKKKYKMLDDKFLFIGPGYNVRPTDIQAAIALNQFKRLNKFIKIRNNNRNKIINTLQKHKKWDNQFKFVSVDKKIKPSWFGLPIQINDKFLKNKKNFLNFLSTKGIETRPIISGNFLNQPASKIYKFNSKKNDFINANEIEKKGFFIGLHTKPLKINELKFIVENLLNINLFK